MPGRQAQQSNIETSLNALTLIHLTRNPKPKGLSCFSNTPFGDILDTLYLVYKSDDVKSGVSHDKYRLQALSARHGFLKIIHNIKYYCIVSNLYTPYKSTKI